MTPQGLADLKDKDEGFRSKIYYDTMGIASIGVGTNLAQGISLKQAMALAVCELDDITVQLNALSWYSALNPVRQDVIQNMCYNIGFVGVLGFRNMITCITAQNWVGAADAMLNSKWASQVPNRAKRLAALIVSGTYITASFLERI